MQTGHGDGLDYWIGAEDLDNDGTWRWTTSGKPLSYNNWKLIGHKKNCAQYLRRVGSDTPLDSFYFAYVHSCENDGDNGVIFETQVRSEN